MGKVLLRLPSLTKELARHQTPPLRLWLKTLEKYFIKD